MIWLLVVILALVAADLAVSLLSLRAARERAQRLTTVSDRVDAIHQGQKHPHPLHGPVK